MEHHGNSKRRVKDSSHPNVMLCCGIRGNAYMIEIDVDNVKPLRIHTDPEDKDKTVNRPLTNDEKREVIWCSMRYGKSGILYRIFKSLRLWCTKNLYPSPCDTTVANRKRKRIIVADFDNWQAYVLGDSRWSHRDTLRYVRLYLFGTFRDAQGRKTRRNKPLLPRLASVLTKALTCSLKPSQQAPSPRSVNNTERDESVENLTV